MNIMRNIINGISICFVIFMLLGAKGDCDSSYEGQGETQNIEAQLTEQNQKRLIKAQKPPILKDSLERKQLIARLNRFNNPNKVSYIYLTEFGKVMGFYTIRGKVSSVNSKLTTGEQIVNDPYKYQSGGKVVESPQLDGSYGTNGDAIFFFTTDGIYIEWNGNYMLCDEPLQMSTPPALVYTREVK